MAPLGGKGAGMKSISEGDAAVLIDHIYEAGMSFERWPDALNLMADLFGVREASLGTESADGIPWLLAPRTDPAFMQLYAEAYHPLNDVYHEVIRRGVGALATDTMLAPREDLAKSAFHNEWSAPQGYHTKLGGVLLAGDGWRTVFMLTDREEFSLDDLRLLQAFTPHLKRAVQMNVRLAQADLASHASAQLLEQMPAAAFLVDGGARVLFANADAERLVQADRGLRLVHGTLSVERPADEVRLRGLIAAGTPSPDDEVLVLHQAGGPPLQLQVMPVRGDTPLLAPTLAAAILFDVSRRPPANPAERLRAKYGFTSAEAAFALEIARGDGKQAAAERRGVSFATARTHLSRIFEKTGVHRQAELVRLMMADLGGHLDA